jgi:hypothetical protein
MRRWCGSWRRGMRRGASGRCGAARRRSSLWRLLGFSIGTKFFLGLGHNQRRALRVRWRAYKLQRRQSGGGKQQQTKFCHDGVGPRKILGRKVCRQFLVTTLVIKIDDQRTSVRPDCGGLSTVCLYLFLTTQSPIAALFITHSGVRLKPHVRIVPAAYPRRPNQSGSRIGMPASKILRYQPSVTGLSVLAGRAPAIRQAFCLAIPLASEVRRAPASVAVLRAADFLADSPAAVPPVFRA